MRILIAEDDEALANFIRKGLEAEHHAVDVSRDGEQARALILGFDYDLVLLDLNLPRLDAVSILKSVRESKPELRVLILTARSRVEDRVLGLDTGADDYLAKPFSFSELSARIRALLRRTRLHTESILVVDDLRLDRIERRVMRAGKSIDLTSKEFALLEYLMRNAGRRVTRAMIIEHVWNLSFDSSTNLVDVYASSQVDKRKVGQLAAAIQAAFQQMGAFSGFGSSAPVNPNIPLDPEVMRAIEAAKHESAQMAAPAHPAPPSDADLASLRHELETSLASEIERNEVALRVEPDGLVISLREIGFFDSGSAVVREDALSAFGRIARLLLERDYRVRIEGHTDNRPIHNAQFADNWELSTARAAELVRLLITRYGFSPANLSAAGYAEYHPVATNDKPESRAQNRRVDVVVLGKATPPGPRSSTPASPSAATANPPTTPSSRPPAKPSPAIPLHDE
jgi:DNA-binding response OmpR family regulator/outer membrane protein OmpA-like peptidoglycan-associated protein